jgi:hypothetical protein
MADPIGLLVTTRAVKHLRLLAGISAVVLAIVAGVVLLLQAQSSELHRNVVSNPNVHVIEVTYRSGVDHARQLTFSDVDEIARVVTSVSDVASVIPRYVLPFGMSDASESEFFIEALAGDATKVIGVPVDAAGVAAAVDAARR